MGTVAHSHKSQQADARLQKRNKAEIRKERVEQ